jgi:hypothetical protein
VIEQTPQPGDIGLTSVRGPVGRLISLGEFLNGDGFTTWEHAFIVLDCGRLIEAQPGGARIEPLAKYDRRDVVYVAPAGLTDNERRLVCEAAESYEGVGYSAADYFAIAAHRFRLPVPWLRRYVASSGHMICSQLCDRAYQDAGIQLFKDGRWPGYVVPADLWRLLGQLEVPGARVDFSARRMSSADATRFKAEFEKRQAEGGGQQ